KSPSFDTAQLRKTQDDPGTALLKKTASESETEFLRKPASESDTAFIKNPDGVPAPERERGSYDGDTAIKLYLREIGQVKLLTPQEEIELAAKIKKGEKKAREKMIKAN